MLGALGHLLSLNLRIILTTVLALLAIVFGALELCGRVIKPLQCDRETAQRWLNYGALRWATLNGLALGFGAGSRLGFWLWYVVPLGALLIADPFLGALIYGAYSFTRGAAVWFIILGLSRWVKGDIAQWLIGRHHTARLIAAGQLVLLGLVVAVVVGL
jgi:hypothetical protein